MNLKVLAFALLIVTSGQFACERSGGCMPPKNFKLLISESQIKDRIQSIASRLDHDYANKEILLVMIMKGALILTSDLMRAITTPCALEYVQASSYGNKTVAGELTLTGLERLSLKDKHVLLVDDIYDTGNTINAVKQQLLQKEPASLKTLVLLLKNKERTTKEVPDYFLFPIENKWVIGYGLDNDEFSRGIPAIYAKES